MIDFSKLPNKAPDYDLESLLEAGCHFGHQKRKWHPKMAEYIYAEKDGVHIFDLAKTAEQLKKAYNYVYQLGKEGKNIIIIGTKRQAREVVKTAALDAGLMYINSRWLGGFLTNWEQIKKSLKRMIEIEEGLKTDKFKGYTKYEQVQLEKERVRKARFFEGVRELVNKKDQQLPDCLFVIDTNREKISVKEANQVGIPVIGLADSNANPSLLDIVIPANDDALKSLSLIVNEIAKAYKEGKKESKK